jgi:hypothetical protein
MATVETFDDRVPSQKESVAVIRPARIVEIRQEGITPSYSWYSSWTTGCESIYSLLAKFTLLNCLPIREIASLVVSSQCGRKSLLVQQLDIDLRDPKVFDISKIEQLCHTSEQVVTSSFVLGKYVGAWWRPAKIFDIVANVWNSDFIQHSFSWLSSHAVPSITVFLNNSVETARGSSRIGSR